MQPYKIVVRFSDPHEIKTASVYAYNRQHAAAEFSGWARSEGFYSRIISYTVEEVYW